jgi:hypothetical protein
MQGPRGRYELMSRRSNIIRDAVLGIALLVFLLRLFGIPIGLSITALIVAGLAACCVFILPRYLVNVDREGGTLP